MLTPKYILKGKPSWGIGWENVIQPYVLEVDQDEVGNSCMKAIAPSGEAFFIHKKEATKAALRRCVNGVVMGRVSFDGYDAHLTTLPFSDEPTGGMGTVMMDAGDFYTHMGEMTLISLVTRKISRGVVLATKTYDGIVIKPHGKEMVSYCREEDHPDPHSRDLSSREIIASGFWIAVRGDVASWQVERNGKPFSGEIMITSRYTGRRVVEFHNGQYHQSRNSVSDYHPSFKRMEVVVHRHDGTEMREPIVMAVVG